MRMRYLVFFLLIGLPGALHAQRAAQPCSAPSLDGGYFVPEQESYSHESEISYTCDSGRKLVVEGWWATSTCQDGAWSRKPRCIDEKACLSLKIPNGKYNKRRTGWYHDRSTIRVTCEDGYELKNRRATAICLNGAWSSVPVCEISIDSCGVPPKIPHAVIIGQRYQKVFPADSELQYECQVGYTVENAGSKKSIICMAGNWNECPTCSKQTTPDAGHGGPEEAKSSRGHSTSPGSGTRTGSGVDQCGVAPVIQNDILVQEHRMHLKYQCNAFYTLEGPDTVTCYSDQTWSELPQCKEAFCVLDLSLYRVYGLQQTGKLLVKEGNTKVVSCVRPYHESHFTCKNRRITYTYCCSQHDHNYGYCQWWS
ncbi:complement factor H-related protein 1-like [Cheilinus undulatus]|uniref:complement factor H-related protein 1-like n=1 Tax=Cheilinus undulatus TaxID=241271 RepID=UPI001BD4C482|nr:complement factor H-related protein 1-like [Cheilinus undulatus]